MSGAFETPPVVKNLIIINCLFFMAEAILPHGLGDLLIDKLGLYYWGSEHFRLYQISVGMLKRRLSAGIHDYTSDRTGCYRLRLLQL